jgi:hypothetical protein
LVKRLIVHPDVALEQVTRWDPEVAVAVKPVTAAPPFEVGLPHVTSIAVLAPKAVTPVGGPGTVDGVVVAVVGGLGPITFLAMTLKVYFVPFVSPEKTQLRCMVFVQLAGGFTRGDEVTE